MSKITTTEAEVRGLRDLVYGKPICDNGWEGARRHWMEPVEVAWLRQQVRASMEKNRSFDLTSKGLAP